MQTDVPRKEFARVVVAADAADDGGARHGDYAVASIEVIQTADLPAYRRTVQSDVIRAEYRQSICPIRIGAGEFAIVLTRPMLNTEVVDEVYSELKKQYRPHIPAIYVATQAVVSELARADNAGSAERVRSADRDSPLFKLFVEIVDFALGNGVSDIHFRLKLNSEYSQIGFRMDGNVIRPRKFRMTTDQMQRMLAFMYSFRGNSTTTSVYSVTLPLQCNIEETISGQALSFRWSQIPIHKGLKVVLRMMKIDAQDAYTSIGMQPNGAGLPPYQEKTIMRSLYTDGGGWIFSGRVNSGKSKFLQTLVNLMPPYFEINSAEDPIEYLHSHEGSNQYSASRGLGDGQEEDAFHSFKLQNKRTDPDVTVVSELRDITTTGAFRDAVLAGQRGFTTIHSPNALAIFNRLMSEEFGLARDIVTMPGFLKMLIHLALVPKTCAACALPAASSETNDYLRAVLERHSDDAAVVTIATESLRVASAGFLARLEGLFSIDVSNIRVRNPIGCPHCRREGVPELNGIRGRTLVAQIIEPNDDMLLLVRESKNIELQHYYRSLRTAGFDSDNSDGKSPLEIAMYKVSRGEICLTEAEKRFQSIEAYEHELKRLARGDQDVVSVPAASLAEAA
ncbi:ATPase, T2SS/T4P/T4SS family [Burkholderia multivorans]|uniref:ATPase, T2SS/T4P/T4SS family n=1 Tax=Burkholderia multivorans TaxID=87883 RepID=UPI000582EBA5|nr:ATPase, T2SS/T4P/T4SS family [Burkholderia multivorans]KHS09401.1 hypothetical protein BMD20_29415 [Burkholderia multivorans]KHS10404.1 hypothetical protein BMD22_28415 [Burkholderia multivorans]MDR9230010.1 Toxin coregulated pilus biosynthesis protein T [Burkholderia multivorans]HDR9474375.1 Flp pilus assembly complex ATPase component TadA [Burkholderia multivorans]HDR9480217.1 Flp pilus assembly complex ATPase component TadA [Burkholderia multivorans]